MFEQTFLTQPDSARRPWSLAASLAVQCAFTGILLLVPLIQTAQLAWRPAPPILYIPPRPLPPPVAVRQASSAAPSAPVTPTLFRPVFTALRHIPTSIVTLPDPSGLSAIVQPGSSAGAGIVPFGPPSLGAENGPPAAPAPVKAAPKPALLRVSNGVQAAKLLQQPKPPYPPLAKAARISGLVRLQAIIGRDGTIRNLRLVSGAPLLVKAAFEAVSQWTYKPTLLNGEPVEVFTEIDVNFTLNQ